MRRMVWLGSAIALLVPSGLAQQSAPLIPQSQVSPAGARRSGGNPGRTAQSSLTNADVVRLVDCGSPDSHQFVNLGGNFAVRWVGDDLHATWQAQYCKPINCGGPFQGSCWGEPPSSNYAVSVWVTGPRGVDPWTGKPNSDENGIEP